MPQCCATINLSIAGRGSLGDPVQGRSAKIERVSVGLVLANVNSARNRTFLLGDYLCELSRR